MRQQVKCNGCGKLVKFRSIYKRATLSVLASKRQALHAFFEIEKPYRLEQKVESILFYEIDVVYRAFKTRVPFQRLEPDDLAQVAHVFKFV